jgi:hypothetical protein
MAEMPENQLNIKLSGRNAKFINGSKVHKYMIEGLVSDNEN